jgi:hypothetical protein
LTLSEAARTGRKFHRRGEPARLYWLEGNTVRSQEVFDGCTGPTTSVSFGAEALVATDWEVEPIVLELTAADIIRAARELDGLCSKRRLSAAEFAQALCKELGLIEAE